MKKSDELFWREQVSKWEKSGLSQARFCKNEGLIPHNFSRWKKLIQSKPTPFIELQESKSFSIEFEGGISIKFDHLPDAKWIGSVLGEIHATQAR